MTNTPVEMTEDEFDAKYPLLKNYLNPNASWVYGDGPGCLFETYGEELEFVQQQDPCTVWTLVDGDDGDQYLVSGFHFVNRIGYLVSTITLPEAVHVEVRIPMQTAPSDEAAEDESVMTESAEQASELSHDRMPATSTEVARPATPVPTPLLVCKGAPLAPGKMYLRLYHGRTDPNQDMEEWGFDGPTFGPLSSYIHTYCCHFRIYGESNNREVWLETHDDMIHWDGCLYGDMEVFIAGTNDRA